MAPWPGERMDHVRRIADQCAARRDVGLGAPGCAAGSSRARWPACIAAEHARRRPPRGARSNSRRSHSSSGARERLIDRPDDRSCCRRTAAAARAARCAGSAARRCAACGLPVCTVATMAQLAVVARAHRQAGALAHQRLRRHRRRPPAAPRARSRRRSAARDRGVDLERIDQLAADQHCHRLRRKLSRQARSSAAILGDVAEIRLADVGGIEAQDPRRPPQRDSVPHAHALIGAQALRDRAAARRRRRAARARWRARSPPRAAPAGRRAAGVAGSSRRQQCDACGLDAGMARQQGRGAGAGQAAADRSPRRRHVARSSLSAAGRATVAAARRQSPSSGATAPLGRRAQVEQQQSEIARRDHRARAASPNSFTSWSVKRDHAARGRPHGAPANSRQHGWRARDPPPRRSVRPAPPHRAAPG